ncbi:hypothetical protein EC973_004214 [Apophysomyces ossiformis]|uniref:DNA-directed RNA polymerase III subunit n=1 Tax=Apophysomyces ossiformis TaxID=679940 RepID=A0A8H7BT39_9FUNG|nr:hypothetical protein EC973_004214 [Apophysomyces ossiformis]
MSRGGRGGFGRGGGGGANSGAMQLVSFDLLKDLGSGSLFNVNTALFPEMDVPIPHKPSPTEKSQVKLREEYLKLVRDSPFHLQAPQPPPDIERYSDKYKKAIVKRTLREIKTDYDFFPEELQSILDPSKMKKKRKIQTEDEQINLDAILNEAAEEKDEDEEKGEDGEKKEGGSEGEYEEDYEDEEELVDDNDYAQNYFDNGEGDEYDDDDGEGGGDYY